MLSKFINKFNKKLSNSAAFYMERSVKKELIKIKKDNIKFQAKIDNNLARVPKLEEFLSGELKRFKDSI